MWRKTKFSVQKRLIPRIFQILWNLEGPTYQDIPGAQLGLPIHQDRAYPTSLPGSKPSMQRGRKFQPFLRNFFYFSKFSRKSRISNFTRPKAQIIERKASKNIKKLSLPKMVFILNLMDIPIKNRSYITKHEFSREILAIIWQEKCDWRFWSMFRNSRK